MGRGRRFPKGPKSLRDKVRDIDTSFADGVYSMTDDDLKNRLAHYSKEQATIEDAKKEDVDLKRLRGETKTASESYTVPLKAIKLKTRLVLEVLKDRGKELT